MVGLCRERVEGTLVHVRSAGDLLVCAVGAFALNLQQMAPTSLLGKSQHTGVARERESRKERGREKSEEEGKPHHTPRKFFLSILAESGKREAGTRR